MKKVKIANGQGFWGDSIEAPSDLINYGKIDYLTLDYLAEVTISIMQKQKMKNPNYGYALDFPNLIINNYEKLIKNNIKVITNAGGVNPKACADKIKTLLNKKKINIGIVEGDDILNNIDYFIDNGVTFQNIDTGESIDKIKNSLCSANVYIDSYCIKEALDMKANIVLSGRVSDPGLTLGPLLHEFNWKKNDYNKLASGTLAGHIIECGAQCTGGNFTRWYNIKDLYNIGYPIANVSESGDFSIIKPPGTGGQINQFTITEQILYEMGDPKNYISPDVCVDFTSLKLDEKNNDKVLLSNIKGFEPTNTFKVSISYLAGYKSTGQLTISGPNSYLKAKKTAEIIWERLNKLGLRFDKSNTEYIGKSDYDNDNDITLRLSVLDKSKDKVARFGKEISPVITSGVPGTTGFSGGRPKPQEVIAYWPALIPKKLIKTKVTLI